MTGCGLIWHFSSEINFAFYFIFSYIRLHLLTVSTKRVWSVEVKNLKPLKKVTMKTCKTAIKKTHEMNEFNQWQLKINHCKKRKQKIWIYVFVAGSTMFSRDLITAADPLCATWGWAGDGASEFWEGCWLCSGRWGTAGIEDPADPPAPSCVPVPWLLRAAFSRWKEIQTSHHVGCLMRSSKSAV